MSQLQAALQTHRSTDGQATAQRHVADETNSLANQKQPKLIITLMAIVLSKH